MFVIAIILFIVALALCFIEEQISAPTKIVILAIMTLVMICTATFKNINTTADAENYVNYFYNNSDPLIELMTEPTFIYLSRFLISIGAGIQILFLIYACITIPTKCVILYKLTEYIFTAMLIYIPVYFLLHDVVQIRTGAAAAFLLSSLYLSCKGKHLLSVVAFIASILFHYSSLAFLPVLLFGNRRFNLTVRILLFMTVPLGLILYIANYDILNLIPSSVIVGKIDFYKDAAETGDKWSDFIVPYKNMYLLSKCALLFLCLIFYETILKHNRFASICILMLAFSIFINLSMTTIPVLAGRLGDLYGISDAISFTLCLHFIKPRWAVRSGIALIGMYMMAFNYFNGGFIV